ncbi:hypothetical protein sS8_1952 [Methylocaldum marinum]|uniref:Uncharacterized protein n=1 Tax=Methylocaldum marinum TaxID=1432792 RepID=A0A250KQV1_9GAMM|nr:hypothetical protein sS8_1952 [Methylocaldum marinum]
MTNPQEANCRKPESETLPERNAGSTTESTINPAYKNMGRVNPEQGCPGAATSRVSHA